MKTIGGNLLWLVAVAAGVYVGMSAVGVSQQQAARPSLPISPIKSPSDLSLAFRQVADRILPAVVTIRAEANAKQVTLEQGNGGGRRQSPFGGNSPFEDELFKQFFGPNWEGMREQMEQQRGYTPPREGTGSGFVVDGSGVVLTNSHVVEGADRIYVQFQDGREFKATSWNYDPRSDVAIVRFEPGEAIPSLVLGDSDQMQVGDWVIAAGNPMGIGTSVTAGIISATGRNSAGINEREDYLQTDAAINPGNSGGPLINLHGEVIGINTAISTRSGGYDGVGFAIPSNNARWIAEQLIQNGTVKRSYLGVQLQMLNNDLREQMGVPQGQGTLVSDVKEGSPAEKAGFQSGDVVLEFGREPIGDSEELVDLVERSPVGSTHPVKILRDGKPTTLNVTVEAMSSNYTPALARAAEGTKTETPKAEEKSYAKLGLQITDLTDELRDQLGLDKKVSGAVVAGVRPNSIASQAGIQSGDVIERVGQKPVKSLADFEAAVKGLDPAKGILLFVRSGDAGRFIVLKSEE